MLFKNTVELRTYKLLEELSSNKLFSAFYLGGGTALALQIGHRKSIDLDFFTNDPFDEEALIDQLKPLEELLITNTANNTVQTFLNDV